jgi:hypothetical protein
MTASGRIGSSSLRSSSDRCLAHNAPPSRSPLTGLHALGVIRYARGIITIIDRAGLESAVCRCYDVMEADYALAFA